MWLVGSQNALIVISTVFDFQDAMVVREQSGHEAGACRGAGRACRMGILKADASSSQAIKIRGVALTARANRGGLHTIGNKEQDIWAFGSSLVFGHEADPRE
jgi:hypothetical protein